MPAIQSERMRREMSTTTLGTMIDFYGADMRLKNRTTDSINSNLGHLRRLAEHAGGRDLKLSRITPEIARDYVAWLQSRQARYEQHPNRPPEAQPLSPFTIRKAVKILRGFGTWLTRDGLSNPFADLDIPSVPKRIVETLRPDEVAKILAAIKPNTPNGARNLPMVLLFLDSGPRVSEVASLKLSDLDLDGREAKLMGKGRKERRIPFGQKTARALMRYVSAFRPQPADPKDDCVFLSVDGYPLTRNAIELIIRRLRVASGVRKLHPHLLRHTFAVNFLAAGGELETLRRILGHESREVTKRYLSGLNAAQVRKLYDEYSPIDRLTTANSQRRFTGQGPRAAKCPSGTTESQMTDGARLAVVNTANRAPLSQARSFRSF